ncbi:signal peptidase I [Halopenitus sp. H-Gu1]|uniref:signal peptidase I n=1 Tax=Halopenitus sp. H-Gu1 TaxID=3242697 RepID=UPI00359E5BBA
MEARRVAELLFEIAIVVFLVSMIAGQILGQPVLLGFVTSGSMQPTLEPGDGFVAIPAAIAGPIEEGDVVTFRAEEINSGGLTTHRIVEERDRGYITQGDNNPFSDQDGGEPLVTKPQIVAVVWQPGGAVVAIPGVGALVTASQDALTWIQQQLAFLFGTRSMLGSQGLAYLIVGFSVVVYAADVLLGSGEGRDRHRSDRSRDTGIDVRVFALVFAAAIVLAATASMVVPAGTQEFGVVSSERDASGLRVIEQGTSESAQYTVGNGGYVPVVTYFEPASEGMTIEPREIELPARTTASVTITITAPPETGYYRYFLVEHRYLHVLPEPVIRSLYMIHPWLPIVVIDAILGGAFYAMSAMVLDSGRVRSRSRDNPSLIRRYLSRIR